LKKNLKKYVKTKKENPFDIQIARFSVRHCGLVFGVMSKFAFGFKEGRETIQ